MKSDWEDIDAATAGRYLATADTKRPRTASTVNTYKRDMLAGAWFETHQGLAFGDKDGQEVMLDGGHRMLAVIEADKDQPGITIRFWVTRGMDPGAFEGVDIGRTRSTSNMVQAWYPDTPYYKEVGSIARRARTYLSGRPWTRAQSSKHELHAYIEEHPTLWEAARYAHHWKLPRATLPPVAAGFVYWIFTHIDAADGVTFMDRVQSGIGLEDQRDPVWVLRDRLLGSELGRQHPNFLAYRMSARGREPEVAVALTVMAWNKWRNGEKIAKLQLPKGSLLTDETFPVPAELRRWTDPRGLLTDITKRK